MLADTLSETHVVAELQCAARVAQSRSVRSWLVTLYCDLQVHLALVHYVCCRYTWHWPRGHMTPARDHAGLMLCATVAGFEAGEAAARLWVRA